MSATRLLVLGAVRGLGRAHGYLVRTELLRWDADEWANVKWGSLYHALRKLAEEGLLTAVDTGQAPGRVDYEITAAGEEEFFRLLRAALREPATRPDTLAAGLSLLPALTRAEAIDLLTARLHTLRTRSAKITDETEGWGEPAHVRELFGYWVHNADNAAQWTQDVLDRLIAGQYRMADETHPS